MDAILLDKAPVVNDKIVPPPPPQHRLEAAFDFLKGAMGGRWNISLDSTATRVYKFMCRQILLSLLSYLSVRKCRLCFFYVKSNKVQYRYNQIS